MLFHGIICTRAFHTLASGRSPFWLFEVSLSIHFQVSSPLWRDQRILWIAGPFILGRRRHLPSTGSQGIATLHCETLNKPPSSKCRPRPFGQCILRSGVPLLDGLTCLDLLQIGGQPQTCNVCARVNGDPLDVKPFRMPTNVSPQVKRVWTGLSGFQWFRASAGWNCVGSFGFNPSGHACSLKLYSMTALDLFGWITRIWPWLDTRDFFFGLYYPPRSTARANLKIVGILFVLFRNVFHLVHFTDLFHLHVHPLTHTS